ncbi:hypothetical protein AMQ83_07880 [Paenibacillus riograndensis]|nr:hypothetical protein AMQ83_07880 [Paenibacillus riograndensis]
MGGQHFPGRPEFRILASGYIPGGCRLEQKRLHRPEWTIQPFFPGMARRPCIPLTGGTSASPVLPPPDKEANLSGKSELNSAENSNFAGLG